MPSALRVQSMAAIDAMPQAYRELVNEYGYIDVYRAWKRGYSPQTIRERAQDGVFYTVNALVDPKSLTDPQYIQMGPSLLTRQPVTLNPKPIMDNFSWGISTIILRRGSARCACGATRGGPTFKSLATFFSPRRHTWLVVPNKFSRGNPLNDQIIDSTGSLAVRTCASGMWTGLTSPSRPWFKLGIGLPWIVLEAEGKEWLEDTEQRIYTVLGQSNFYTIMSQAFQDVTVFGTAPVIIYEDAEDVIRCYLPCAGEYYLACGARFSVTTLFLVSSP